MHRLIAIIIALLLFGSAGWWGWNHPERLPAALRDRLPSSGDMASGDDGPGASRPQPRPASTAEAASAPAPDLSPDIADPRESAPDPDVVPAEQSATPAPVDAPLPPEKGSDMAIETERVAEALIAAADSRARIEATARAEARATESAKAMLNAVLSPLLRGDSLSPPEIRAAVESLPPAPDPLIAQKRAMLIAEIETIMATATPPQEPDTGDVIEESKAIPADGDALPLQTALPAEPYQSRIRDLLR